jgi:hypothetical protein
MWPIVVDTEFTTDNDSLPTAVSSPVPAAVNTEASLFLPGGVDWAVKWEVLKRLDGKSSLTDLILAQNVINGGLSDTEVVFKSKTILVNGSAVSSASDSTTGDVITQSIMECTKEWKTIEDTGYAAFKLDYRPFNLDLEGNSNWVDSPNTEKGTAKAPVWIIRNGVNDAAQDGNTDFAADWWDNPATKNGNGAVRFTVPEQDENLEFTKKPKWGSKTDLSVTFTIKGNGEKVDVYYATGPTPETGEEPVYPAYYDFKLLGTGTYTAGTDYEVDITTEMMGSNGELYLLLVKDGKMMAGEPGSPFNGITVAISWGLNFDPDAKDLKKKFGASSVKETFDTLRYFITMDGYKDWPDLIKTGDYIDLGALSVGAYNGEGEISGSSGPMPGGGGTVRRLIVVGINSFHSGKGQNSQYSETANDGVPHVVFQFQNLPVSRRMNASDTTTGGYAASEMREYLIPVEGKEGSGKFLAGLLDAGVPKDLMWAPLRHVGGASLQDLLWLPTVKEMGGTQGSSETVGTQARLEYYGNVANRIKRTSDGAASGYWLGSSNGANFYSI